MSNTNQNRVRATEVGDWQMVAALVRGELERRGWTLRQAELETGVGRGTIDNMRNGLRVSPSNLAKWAAAVAPEGRADAERARYLRLAGFENLLAATAGPGQQLEDVADDIPMVQARALLIGMGNVVDVGANLERLTPDEDNGEPLELGGYVRVMRIRHDCLRPLLHPGDVVFLTGADTVVDGDIVVAIVDVFYRTCKVLRCPPDSASYLEPLDGEGRIEEHRFQVLGVVKYRLERVKSVG